jgi:type I restriction enzyme S subunit
MLNLKKYSCGICKTTPDQISHHKSHIETQKHKDKKELFELKLYKLNDEELMSKYKTTVIDDICNETETILYSFNDNNIIKNDSKYNDFKDIQDIMAEQNCISNKDALKDKIHELHNFLRNNGAGYGMNALKVFNVIYGLKKIEEKGLIDKVGLKRPECEFSHLLSLANENKDEELAKFILMDVLDAISESEIKEFLFYEIPKNMKGNVFSHLIKEINNITKIEESCNVLLSGKIYEYFIGRDESAISELGAYFTDRHIVDYIYQKLDPSLNNDGSVSTMIDMFGGSGGFTTGYINYLNEKYPKGINWEIELSKISHYDMNEDVIKSAGLEFFCLTGVLPDMKNLKYKNSFVDEFIDNNDETTKKYKFPITNPPYGGDKNNKTVAQEKREKIKEYIKNELISVSDEGVRIARQKQLKSIEAQEKQDKNESNKSKVCVSSCSNRIQKFANKYSLTGNDKESCSLILLMDILDIGGTAIGVLKEGVFFNKTYKDIRKCLIENYNVREVISVPQDQFENTSTKTSIVIFDNTSEKTSKVKFYDLIVEKYEEDKFVDNNGVIIVSENKDDISGISDTLVSVATREEILANAICSLNAKDYNKKVIVCGEGYELVKIGDICEFKAKSKRKASEGKKEGKYNFYTSSDKVQKCDVADYIDECLIIGSGGVANIKIDKDFSCSADNFIVKAKYNKYIYYLIISNMNILIDGFTGSVLKHLSKEYLVNLQIPIPKSEQKIIEWVDKISKPYDEKNSKQNKIKELEEYVKNMIKDISKNEECDEVELGSVCEFQNGYSFKSTDYEKQNKINIGILQIKSIQNGVVDENKITEYIPESNKYKLFEIQKGDILIALTGATTGKIGIYNLKQKSYLNQRVGKINAKTGISQKYIYYWYLCCNIVEKVLGLAQGTAQPNISTGDISKLKILIPKNKQLIKDIEPTFDEIEKLLGEVKEAETLYNQLIKELSDEAIPDNNISTVNAANAAMPANAQELSNSYSVAKLDVDVNNTTASTSTSSSTTTSSIKSLHEQCKSLGIKGYSKYKKIEDKDKLLKLIEEHK